MASIPFSTAAALSSYVARATVSIVLMALFAVNSLNAQTQDSLAMPESQRLAAYIASEYGPYTRDYTHVSLGHNACAYSFVDEHALDELAKLQLRKMRQRGVELIAEGSSAQAQGLSVAQREYASRLAVETAMELKSALITEELAPQYGSGEADCALSAEQNQSRYRALQAYARP